MLTDEHQFLHTVAVFFVPIATQTLVLFHHLAELGLGHGGKPSTRIAQLHLLASLLEDVTHLFFTLEPADSLHTDDIARQLASHKLIETSQVERCPSKIDKSADAIFLNLTTFVVMVMMVVMTLLVVVVMVIVMVIIFIMAFHLLDPCRRGGYLVKIEHTGIQNLVEVDVAVVALNDLRLGLEGADNLFDTSTL